MCKGFHQRKSARNTPFPTSTNINNIRIVNCKINITGLVKHLNLWPNKMRYKQIMCIEKELYRIACLHGFTKLGLNTCTGLEA